MKKTQCSIPLPPIIFKIGEEEHMHNLINKGEIYFGSLAGYRGGNSPDYMEKLVVSLSNLEHKRPDLDFYRVDPLECIKDIRYDQAGNAKISYYEQHTHALCLFGFAHSIPLDFKISSKMQNFATHYAIFDSKLFLETICPILNEASAFPKPQYGYVKYYNFEKGENVDSLTPFHKKKFYDYQCEYRILANLQNNIISIGDVLKNHSSSMCGPIKELYDAILDIRPM